MSDKEIHVVCAGLGFVGAQAHVPSFRKVPGSKCVGIVARKGRTSEKIATKISEKYGIAIRYDWDEVCKDPDVDAVCVAVPTPYHYRLAKTALEGGKHVYLEMPMVPKHEQVEELAKIAKDKGVVLMPVLNFRYVPGYVKMKELVAEGRIGKPTALTFREFVAAKDLAEQWPLSSWAWDKEKSGGYPDYTLSLWSLDMFRWFFDTEIENVAWAANYMPIDGVDDFKGYHTVGIIKLRNGVVGNLTYGSSVVKSLDTSRFEVFGNNGLVLTCDWNDKVTLFDEDNKTEFWKLERKGTEVWGHKQTVAHFIQVCLGNEEQWFDYKDALTAQKWSDKIVTDLM